MYYLDIKINELNVGFSVKRNIDTFIITTYYKTE